MKENFLHRKLEERKEQHAFRQLRIAREGMIDLCSNDYLGIVKNNLLHSTAIAASYGSTGSRLLTGNYELIEETEQFIASFHQSAASLIFNSGYDANIGLLSSVPQRGDTILYDHLSHASIRDGIRLSLADAFSFQHNAPDDLESRLQKSTGNVFIVTESIFSMDGDICPLKELVELSQRYNANLVIDEAHATGVLGEKGEGLVQLLGLQEQVFARIHTFGKACGLHGAAVLGSTALRDYLINFARSFMYTTALPEETIRHIKTSYEVFPRLQQERKQLNELVAYFQSAATGYEKMRSRTPIQGVVVPGNAEVRRLAEQLQAHNLDIRPILYPTVPKGLERVRIVLHAFNTKPELDLLLNCLKNSF
jgi:8-amino-7-oxononanoate synthase